MNLKDIRLRKGLTQSEVASALGISSVVYSRDCSTISDEGVQL